MKKIMFYFSLVLCLIFSFLFAGKYINTLAMGNFDNSIGTIPIQMDIDNYDNVNIVPNDKNEFACFLTWHTTCVLNNGVSITSNYNGSYDLAYTIITNDLSKYVTETGFYRFTIFTDDNIVAKRICVFGNDPNTQYWQCEYNSNTVLLNVSNNILNKPLRIAIYNANNNSSYISSIKVNNFMVTKNDTIYNYYSPYFEFGFYADLYYAIVADVGNTSTVNYYFNDNTYTKSTTNVNTGYLFENMYLPYNIDEKGYISFPKISFGISSISNSSSNATYSLLLTLKPVFNAYYKGESTNNIYTNLNYNSNDLFVSGLSFSKCIEENCRNGIGIKNLSIGTYTALSLGNENETGSNYTTNVSTYYNDDIKFRNYFEFNNYLNLEYNIGDLAQNYSKMNKIDLTFGISNISSRIIDNQTTTTPLPDNELTFDKYNTCSAWYDIPCQLGNAITYVIYEAPIISPILTFVVSFITMFSSLVTFVDLFKSFGIVFGCFVIYTFIELLHKYSK